MDQQTTRLPYPAGYRTLQSLFMLGCIFNIGLTFVPSMSVKVAGFFNVEEKLMSALQAVQFAFQTGQTGLGLIYVAFFAAWVAGLVMAVVYQRRWVFIVGASLSAFLLSGFFAKPPLVEAGADKNPASAG